MGRRGGGSRGIFLLLFFFLLFLLLHGFGHELLKGHEVAFLVGVAFGLGALRQHRG